MLTQVPRSADELRATTTLSTLNALSPCKEYCIPLVLRGLARDAAYRRRKWFEAGQAVSKIQRFMFHGQAFSCQECETVCGILGMECHAGALPSLFRVVRSDIP